MTVQVLAGPVVANRGARVGVTRGDLDVSEVDVGIEHGRDGMTEHMRVRPGDRMSAALASWCRPPVAACRSIRPPRLLSRTGPRVRDPIARSMAPADCRRQRDQDDLGALAAHAQHPVAALFAEICDVRSGGLEDPQAQQAEHGHQREVARVRRFPGGVSSAPNCRWVNPSVGD